jgi:hypothetical protein
VVAKPEAIALVDYLISLKRTYPITDSSRTGAQQVGLAPAAAAVGATSGGARGGR